MNLIDHKKYGTKNYKYIDIIFNISYTYVTHCIDKIFSFNIGIVYVVQIYYVNIWENVFIKIFLCVKIFFVQIFLCEYFLVLFIDCLIVNHVCNCVYNYFFDFRKQNTL